MALPKYVALGKVSNGGFDRSGSNANEIVEASQTDHTNIALGNGNDTLITGDFDDASFGSGTDTFYGARSSVVTAGTGHDTFIFGVSSKPQTADMLGTETIFNYDTSKDAIQISHTVLSSGQLQTALNNASFNGTDAGGAEYFIPLDNQGNGLDIVTNSNHTSFEDLAKTIKIV